MLVQLPRPTIVARRGLAIYKLVICTSSVSAALEMLPIEERVTMPATPQNQWTRFPSRGTGYQAWTGERSGRSLRGHHGRAPLHVPPSSSGQWTQRDERVDDRDDSEGERQADRVGGDAAEQGAERHPRPRTGVDQAEHPAAHVFRNAFKLHRAENWVDRPSRQA